ncbi:anthranilate synthase component I family protein [Salinimicrobium sp. TH3]|uniref:anthranilate synthase component I family protein n=1 Tax=Salinimicrobium sp. TH3 TaxID=2997342 RepID=UPI00227547BE|nr:anthranilate synthase component I family protein [Salinimicrobium sp. TH3]MCY2688026.1 anthranilate synthase component I family protein [Salinimicrobium sp. TH3]
MYKLNTTYKKLLADTFTPVSVYLRLRDIFPNSLLLESSDYHGNENSFSYICCNPIAGVKVEKGHFIEFFPDGTSRETKISSKFDVPAGIHDFSKKFKTTGPDFNFINEGLFGYIAYDGVQYFEKLNLSKKKEDLEIPEINYSIYQNIIAINHFNNEAYIFDHSFNSKSNLEQIEQLLKVKNFASYAFSAEGEPASNETDEGYRQMVLKAKEHCHRGDVFQLVLSRRFSQAFKGDEFNVYRALRNVNPSPYLFYFDYGSFKIFGSSPEAQLVVKEGKAEIHPIAGTFKRTGNDEQDAASAKVLAADEKENAEHVMLVDLARNDLSRSSKEVKVENYKEIQYFSHVIHLVSKVTGIKNRDVSTMQMVADTFPAGTLSGAPKHKAMQLIEKYENVNRDFYGGAIGFMDFNGNFNHAIIIRSFLSKNHRLYYQAGAGVVSGSTPEGELQEVYNKIGALKKALELAEEI